MASPSQLVGNAIAVCDANEMIDNGALACNETDPPRKSSQELAGNVRWYHLLQNNYSYSPFVFELINIKL